MGRFAGRRLAVQGAASRLELITAKRPFATGRNGSIVEVAFVVPVGSRNLYSLGCR